MTAPKVLEGYISRPDLARELGIHVRTIGRYQNDGLKYIRCGTSPYFRREDVLEFLEKRTEAVGPNLGSRGRRRA